jgi:NAD(P)-dependent dehydrogenase (short-subunit alcohol dehydrogenase family)
MKHILITGVSSGIGYAAARDLISRSYHVFGSVRREEDVQRLRDELGPGLTPLLFDVTEHATIESAVAQMSAALEGQNLTALVNNAGITTPGPLLHMSLHEFRQQFEVNLFGLLDVTQQVAPLLGARPAAPQPAGRIVNIGSVSGKVAYPFMGAYAASKHALEALSDALRRELMLYGVDVILIEPGTVNTPIVGKFAEQVQQYMDTAYAPILRKVSRAAEGRETSALPVAAVTRVIRLAIESPRPRTRYPIPRKWFTGWLLPRWLPNRWFDYLIARQLNLK